MRILQMRRSSILIVMSIFIVSLSSCKLMSRFSVHNDDQVVAKVGDAELYYSDIQSIFSPGMPMEDSLGIQNSVIDTWVKKQLKLQSAQENIDNKSEDEIEKKVDEYRNSLIIYYYEQQMTTNKIDTTVSNEQIDTYYEDNAGQFLLYKPIIKGRILRYPADYRQESKLRELMRANDHDSYLDLVDIAEKNGMNLEEFPNWTEFAIVANYLPPLPKDTDLNTFLSAGKAYESTDKQYGYILKIDNVRHEGDQQPLEHIKDMIAITIVNQRKNEALKNIEDSLYNHALENKKIILNTNTTKE